MSQRPHRLGILAGGGSLPREIAESVLARGGAVHIVALKGEANGDFTGLPVTWVNWGEIGTMIQSLKTAGIDDLIIVGGVHRPEVWGLRPDLGFFKNLPAIVKIVASGGDDSVLRRVIRFFEQHDLKVSGPAAVAPELVIAEGPLGAVAVDPASNADVTLGFEVIRALGPFDVGQSVVVGDGRIEAIEGAEGTDRMIERASGRRGARLSDPPRGVIVKRSKPGQDLRVDMPTIGPSTVARAVIARLKGIAVEAGKVIVARRKETITEADATQTFVAGVVDAEAATGPIGRYKATATPDRFRRLSRVEPAMHAITDADKGLAAVRALSPLGTGETAVVVRNHVLAVDAGEGPIAVIERASVLRQWASLTRRRRGVAVLARSQSLTPAVVEAIERAGYAGAAVRDADYDSALFRQALEAADQAGLFVIAPREETGG